MSPSADELALLRRYGEHRDEQAFATLVRRYISLVYSAATRRVGDRHLADDITQAVFMILAKKAKSIRSDVPLSNWLLTTVRYAAANALRIQSRRRRHEQTAAADAPLDSLTATASADPSEVIIWQEIASHLDDAILKLPAADRHAVLLRYFENRPMSDIAASLAITENTAKQRVSRAVDKLRQRLAATGVTPTVFATLLARNVIHSAPPALVHSTCAVAVGSATSAATATIAKGATHMMTFTKAKIAAAVLIATTLAGTGLVAMNHAGAQPAQPDPADHTVLAAAPPVVVSTVPQAGATDVDPNITEIKVTFSKDMHDKSWSWVQTDEHFPKTAGNNTHYLPDHRTCVFPVKLEPGKPYSLWLNNQPYMNFTDTTGHSAVPYILVFETRAK